MFSYHIDCIAIVTQRLARARCGAVALMFALSAMAVLMAVGIGIDLGRTYIARQQLSAVAALTCQYANRPAVASLAFGSGGSSAYAANVNAYYLQAFADQNVTWSQTDSPVFSYTAGGAGTVAVAATIPTTMVKMIGVTTMPVGVSQQCFTALGTVPQPVPDSSNANPVTEGFENTALPSSFVWYLPNGQPLSGGPGDTIPVVNTPSANAGYIGSSGTQWLIQGYCLEIDYQGETVNQDAQGTHGAELDCDNGNGSAGNSSISTRVNLMAGAYELRWNYASRIYNSYYDTSYVCGTTAADTAWANDTSYNGGLGARTNQINVYLDKDASGLPPQHTTLDGTQQLAGSNMIDSCVYSLPPPATATTYPYGWIERSVPITITTAGYYWLSFAADGASDSYGGQIDNIRLCQGSCAGTLSDNFPTSWLPTGGNNVTLFEDTFESPAYSGSGTNTNGNVGLSYGSSNAWNEVGQGWSAAPTNRIPYWMSGCPQGNQCVELGWGSGATANQNSLIAKPFLLDPGYYQISYDYVSSELFAGLTTITCGTTPAAAGMAAASFSIGTAIDRVLGTTHLGLVNNTNAVGVFMADGQLVSTPNSSTTLGATTTYSNPDGTTTPTPTVPPASISLTSYNASQNNPLLDICGYASAARTRRRIVLIQKPALYWLIIAALGSADGFGGQIDDVKITALGSPLMTGAPASFITIPVPNPQPGATLNFTGFSISADLH